MLQGLGLERFPSLGFEGLEKITMSRLNRPPFLWTLEGGDVLVADAAARA